MASEFGSAFGRSPRRREYERQAPDPWSNEPFRLTWKSRPLEVVSMKRKRNNYELILNERALESILLRDDVRDKPLCILSVAGAFRSGKSFLLGFIIRYLKSNMNIASIKDEKQHLRGFHWAGGKAGVTSGILMWSEPFFATTTNNKEVVILLMDTQGTRDTKGSSQMSAGIFGLSILISSVQVFNLSKQIEDIDLQELEFFVTYAQYIQHKCKGKPFQKLMFLIRDWKHVADHGYGEEGGDDYLTRELTTYGPNLTPSNRKTREKLHSCFDEMCCFLLPYPGNKVDTIGSDTCDLTSLDIEPSFIENLEELIPSLLSRENLVTKKIFEKEVNSTELMSYIKQYYSSFKSGKLPEPLGLSEALFGMFLNKQYDEAKTFFVTKVKEINREGPVDETVFHEKCVGYFQKAINMFSERIIDEMMAKEYHVKLHKELNDLMIMFEDINSRMVKFLELDEKLHEMATELQEAGGEREEIERKLSALKSELMEQKNSLEEKVESLTKALAEADDAPIYVDIKRMVRKVGKWFGF